MQPEVARATQAGFDELILFGSSGGYTISESFLLPFKKITIFEPDPLARWIFRRRFPNRLIQKTVFQSSDLLNPDGLRSLAENNPRACFIMSNVMGQLHLLNEEQWLLLRSQLAGILKNRFWISYHDRVSGEVKPSISKNEFTAPLSNDALLDHFYPAKIGASATPRPELVDHLTYPLFESGDHSCAYFAWPLFPGTWHLIEAVSSGSPTG